MMLKRKNRRFSIMVAGYKGSGKSSFFNTLFNNNIIPRDSSEDINLYMLNVDCEGIKQKISLIDTPGFGNTLNDTEIQENIINFLKMQFDLFIEEESKIRRNPKFEDTRVHCLLYFISSTSFGLKQTDIAFLTKVKDLVNIIPVISKSDGLSQNEKEKLRAHVRQQLTQNTINIFDFEDPEHCDNINEEQEINSLVPFSIVSSDEDNITSRVRKFNWGTVEIDNTAHSDFIILKEILLGTHLSSLIDYTASDIYEGYRSDMLEACLIDLVIMTKEKRLLYTFGIKDGYKEYDLSLQELQHNDDFQKRLYDENNKVWISRKTQEGNVLIGLNREHEFVELNPVAAKFCYFVYIFNSQKGIDAINDFVKNNSNLSQHMDYIYQQVHPLLNKSNDANTFLTIVKKILMYDYSSNIIENSKDFMDNLNLETIFDQRICPETLFSSFNVIFEAFMSFDEKMMNQFNNFFIY